MRESFIHVLRTIHINHINCKKKSVIGNNNNNEKVSLLQGFKGFEL